MLGILLAMLIPGIALSMGFFPKVKIDERIAISLVLGLTPQLILYFLNKNLFVPVNTSTTLITIATLTFVGVFFWRVKK